ncbi:2607_t:CDS:2, partial [Rhizophagus irregularis]
PMIAGLWKLVYKPLIRLLKKTKELLDGNNFLCGRLLDGSVFPDSTLDKSSACSLDAGF